MGRCKIGFVLFHRAINLQTDRWVVKWYFRLFSLRETSVGFRVLAR